MNDEGLVRQPQAWATHSIVDFPPEWFEKHIVNLTDEQIAEARAAICAHRPRWLDHDRLGLYHPDTREEGR